LADADQTERAPAAPAAPSLSVVIVTYDSARALAATLPAIADQLRDGDDLIVCDNGSADGTADVVRELAPGAILVEAGANLGFAAGCNLAAARASGDLLLLLNPDNVVAPGFRDAIELPALEGRGWSAWQGLVAERGGETINSCGNEVHFTGIAWAGGAGRPRSTAPASPREIAFASGACLAIHREAWEEVGGFSDPYFLYHEDTDLGLRLWLAGHRVGIEPRAVCEHDYDFEKGAAKWRYLERNRWATIVRTYPTRLLMLLLPGLLVTELALLVVATAGGWLPQKLRATFEAITWLPRLLRERRAIQARTQIDPQDFAAVLRPDLDSPFLGPLGRSRPLNGVLRAYWRAVRALL
jgi:GT2 family glycosyltransferase